MRLADLAEACLKLWENVLLKGQDIESLADGGYRNGDSGTLRLIRMVCKTVSHRGCKKSGIMISFEICMEEKNIFLLPIYQFSGYHYNILFINAAGVYYLFHHFADFFNNIELENRLLVAVHWDLKVLVYKVGCRALVLIEKLISEPLWRIMNKEKWVLGMSKHYQNLLECFAKWEVDCNFFLNKETFCDNSFVSHDEFFESLCSPVSSEV